MLSCSPTVTHHIVPFPPMVFPSFLPDLIPLVQFFHYYSFILSFHVNTISEHSSLFFDQMRCSHHTNLWIPPYFLSSHFFIPYTHFLDSLICRSQPLTFHTHAKPDSQYNSLAAPADTPLVLTPTAFLP